MAQPTGRRRASTQDVAPSGSVRDASRVWGAKTATEAAGASEAVLRPRKYRNVKTVVDGITFDSKAEAKRYAELRDGERAGAIQSLEVHPRFPLVVHEQDCGVYEADFAWIDPETGERVIEDVKSAATRKLPTYRLKARLVWAIYGLRVREI